MSIGREDYQERKEARVERLEERADKARAQSAAASHAAHEIMRLIPPGQPILVGHHSERHHRRDLDRIDRNMRKSVEAGEKADYYDRRAASAASNHAISGDDPDAVKKLEDKLAALQKLQATMKAVNAYYRKHKTLDDCPDLTPAARRSIETSWARGWYVGIPFPPYELSNNNANMKRIKDRLAQLRRVDEMEHIEIEFDGGMIVTNEDVNRVQILFDEKPDDATRSKLKSNGFRWSRTEGAWQTQRTPANLRRACYVLGIDPPTASPKTAAAPTLEASADIIPLDELRTMEGEDVVITGPGASSQVCTIFKFQDQGMVTARGGYFFLSDYGTKWAATHIPAQDTPDEEAATAADEGHAAQDAATPATPRAEDKADEIHPAAGIDGYPQCIIPGA